MKMSQISLGPYSNLQIGVQKEISNVKDFFKKNVEWHKTVYLWDEV